MSFKEGEGMQQVMGGVDQIGQGGDNDAPEVSSVDHFRGEKDRVWY